MNGWKKYTKKKGIENQKKKRKRETQR